MGTIYLSAFCVEFQDYDKLVAWAREFPGGPLGLELGTSWKTPDFRPALERQLPAFAGLPVTLHGPFMEMRTEPGSAGEEAMDEALGWACGIYRRLDASSMVLHTHEGPVPAGQEAEARDTVVRSLLRRAAFLRGQGVSLTVENVGYPKKGNVLFDEGQFTALFDKLPPEVGCLIDIGHAMLNGWDIPELIRRLGTRVRGYHLNANDGVSDLHLPIGSEASCCPPEQMDRILRTIGQVTPQAHLVLEYASDPRLTRELIYGDVRRVAALTGRP